MHLKTKEIIIDMTISKSNFVLFKSCPKKVWLSKNRPDLREVDSSEQKHIEEGKQVGDLAKSYFDNTIDVTSFKENNSLDIENMIGLTNRHLLENISTIAEASFSLEGLFCSIDLLHSVEGGYEIYEVKATTEIEKEHLIDAAFQKHVLQKRGLNIVNTYILHLNKNYKRKGKLELDKLFIAERVDYEPLFLQTLRDIENDIESIKIILSSIEEPVVKLASRCKECPFKAYCHKDIPFPTVLDLQGTGLRRYDLYNKGIITFLDVLASGQKLSNFQKLQIDAYLHKKETIIDKDGLKSFLKKITYPIYHLDFETIMLPIPPADGTWPYEQIPTQYSLHIEYEDGRIEHKEFLGTSIDPRREIAESLCKNIPINGCSIAFNKTFERDRLNELANLFDDLSNHLSSIANNLLDLADPFSLGYYYHKAMWNRYSIKSVLPALYPNDPELDYHALPVVHNGGEAMDIYPKMLLASPEEKERIRDGLLKYCCLDTLAMVKVLKRLKDSAS